MYTWEDLATNVHTQYKLYLSCNSKNKDLCSIPNNKRMKLEINCTQFTCNSWLIATREIKEDIWLRKYKLNFNWIFLITYICLILNSDRMPASLVWHTCKFPFFFTVLSSLKLLYRCWNHFWGLYFRIQKSQLINLSDSNCLPVFWRQQAVYWNVQVCLCYSHCKKNLTFIIIDI